MTKVYDLIVLGAGPAGLSAALYAGRSRLSVLVIEKGRDGGQIATTNEIDNYPGQQLEGETGPSLVARMSAQIRMPNVERVTDSIQALQLDGDIKKLRGTKGEYCSRTVILATGARPKAIGCKNEAEFVGRGISYCATCDGPFFEGNEVYVVGGGNSAVEEAIYLTRFARKVTVIHRRDTLRATKHIQEQAFANEKIHFMWNTVVDEVGGQDVLDHMILRNTLTDARTRVDANPEDGLFGLFGFLGMEPNTQILEGVLLLENGYVPTDADMATGIPGVYAAGDIRVKSVRQVITAAADGAIAAVQVEKYLM